MNFYNPYYYSFPTSYLQPKVGFLGKILGRTGVSISNFLNGTQKVLNIANQTIPLVKQVKPVIGNAKTMFKVMSEFKRVEKPVVKNTYEQNEDYNNVKNTSGSNTEKIQDNLGPTFFV